MAQSPKKKRTAKASPDPKTAQDHDLMGYDIIYLIVGLLALFIAGLTIFNGGVVGTLFSNTFRLLVGGAYQAFLGLISIWGLYLIIKGNLPTWSLLRYLGLILVLLSITTVLHVNAFTNVNPQAIFSQTYQLFVNDLITNQTRANIGGGMLGASGYFAFGFLFGKWGTYVFCGFLFILGLLLTFRVPWTSFIGFFAGVKNWFGSLYDNLFPKWDEVKTVFHDTNDYDDQTGDTEIRGSLSYGDESDQSPHIQLESRSSMKQHQAKKEAGLFKRLMKKTESPHPIRGQGNYQPTYQPSKDRDFETFDIHANPVINRIKREEKVLDLDYFDQQIVRGKQTTSPQTETTFSNADVSPNDQSEAMDNRIYSSLTSSPNEYLSDSPIEPQKTIDQDLLIDHQHPGSNPSSDFEEDSPGHFATDIEQAHWQNKARDRQDLMEDEIDKVLAQSEDASPDVQVASRPKAKNGQKLKLPGKSLLKKIPPVDQSEEYARINVNIEKLERTFDSFGVKAKVVRANLGPSVTKYEIEPAIGVKVSKIVSLSDDIALALAARDVRMEAPIPGKSLIGIEVPNTQVSPVSFWEIIDAALESKHILEVPLGRDISGSVCLADLSKMPHLLIAGATGSGKSVGMNVIIVSLLMKAQPDEVKFLMIDPKKVELTMYDDLPHLLTPVVTNPRKAAQALNKVVQEMERRYELFAGSNVRNIDSYNEMVDQWNQESRETVYQKLPKIVVFVDELADLMMVASNDVENAIIRLAQMARAAGIHMIIATQRPSVDVITGIIKANVPSRLAFAVSSGTDSRTILDSVGAEKLLGRGDMLFQPMGKNKPVRVQGAYISDAEVERITDYIKDQQVADYDDSLINLEDDNEMASGASEDEYFQDAADMLEGLETISISQLQRKFRIGYNRAARLIDDLEAAGLVSGQDGSKPRQVL
ncbi:TPA: DNA translocase FtsK [Streptococcus suis]